MPSRTPSADDLARIARLELEAREVVEGFLNGQHRSPYFGQSLEFAQHREYVPGDDTRRLDWKVFSKTDRLYLKLYEEETNQRTLLLVDSSESMRFAGGATRGGRGKSSDAAGQATKFDQACRLAAALSYLLLRQQDSVGLMTFDEQVRQQLATRTSQRHLQAIIATLVASEPSQKTGILDVMRTAADQKSQRGLIVLISDLFVPLDQLQQGLAMFRQRRHEVVVLHTLDRRELDFDFSGTTRFKGLERTGELKCDPRTLRDGYLEALQTYLEQVRRICGRTGADYQIVRTDESPAAAFANLLSRRKNVRR